MDSLVFRCPGCQQPFQVLAEQAGQVVRCPGCESTVQVPTATTATAAPVATTPPPEITSPKITSPKISASGSSQKSLQPAPSSPTKEEQVQAYGCPKCEKPFGIYPSMFGTEMACPHCQQTILVQPKPDPPAQHLATPPARAGSPVVTFSRQPVDHLLPPKFSAVDPAFFYRRHQDGSQVLLPDEDGSLKVVNNRIVRIEHNGQTYELISSPRYERIQRMVLTNVLAVVICGLLIAIVMTLLNG